jgi:hypothetical protein
VTESKMLMAALAYVGRGWPVMAIEPNGKRPLGSCVPNGCYSATLEIEHARAWLRRYPDMNLGIATGVASVDVLDVDTKQGSKGYTAFNKLKAAGLLPEPLAIVHTPSGGLHCYYAGTSQASARLVKHDLDFKSSGGYVVVPPSVVDGRPYELIREQPRGSVLNWGEVKRFLEPPKPVSDQPFSRSRETVDAGIPGLAAWLSRQTEGNRNASLYWACCRALENGASEHDLDELVTVAQSIGLDDREALRTVRSALKTARRSA